MRRPASPAALVGLLALAGCGFGRSAAPLCPDAAIIHGLDRHEAYAGDSRDPAQLRHALRLENLGGGCRVDGETVSMELSIDLVATTGPAYAGNTPEATYFVTVLDPSGAILSKRYFTSTLSIDQASGRHIRRERIEQTIEEVPADETARYRVLFGLQLPEDEALQRHRAL